MKKLLLVAAAGLALGAAVPAQAAVLYSDGPINGTIDGYNISQNFEVADSFTLSTAATVTGADFGEWTTSGAPSTVDWVITTVAFGPAVPSAVGVANLSSTYFGLAYGVDPVYEASFSIPSVSLPAGTYWLDMDQASPAPAFWDQNNGPSSAEQLYFQQGVGNVYNTIPSESFDILGTPETKAAIPEPASMVLLGASLAGLGLIRRKRA